MSNKLNKKWLIVLTSLLLVASFVLSACSSKTTTTTATLPTTTTTTMATATTTKTSATTASSSSTTTSATTTSSTPTTTSTSTLPIVALNGAGATFPAPLYTKWFSEYSKLTGININYQAVGSGAGINQITAGTVDFGASDGIMTDAQVAAAQAAGGPILHIPMTIGPVAIAYNVPGLGTTQLKLTGDVLAKIYLKEINNWNSPAIAALNPGVVSP